MALEESNLVQLFFAFKFTPRLLGLSLLGPGFKSLLSEKRCHLCHFSLELSMGQKTGVGKIRTA